MVNDIPDYTVFYDGECGFCNWSVAYILKHERNNKIHFISLQSKSSRLFFEERDLPQPDLSSVFFLRKGKLLTESSASLYVTKELKLPHSMWFIFIIFPKFFRDWIYSLISKKRHKLFPSFCLILSREQEQRFLNRD